MKLFTAIFLLLGSLSMYFGQTYTFDHFFEYNSCGRGDGGKPIFYRIVSTPENTPYDMALFFSEDSTRASIADYKTELFHSFTVKQIGQEYTFSYENSKKMSLISRFLYDKIQIKPGKDPDSYELELYKGKNDRRYRRKLFVNIEKSDYRLNNQLLIDDYKRQIENITAALTNYLKTDKFIIRKSIIKYPGGEDCTQIVKNHPLQLTIELPEKLLMIEDRQ